ncbi:MAG TPA: hypothetical protein VGE52_01735 [Pirellulales bacterium]
MNDFGDGGYDIALRLADYAGESLLSDQELSQAIAASRPYLFRTEGDVCASGMEFVGSTSEEYVERIQIPAGEYVATVYRFDPDQSSSPEFLIALVRRTELHQDVEFCTSGDTFNEDAILPTGHVGFRVHACNDWRRVKQLLVDVTGHERYVVATAMKEHTPLYLGNGVQTPDRIVALIGPLIATVDSVNGTWEFELDGVRVEPATLLERFGGESGE